MSRRFFNGLISLVLLAGSLAVTSPGATGASTAEKKHGLVQVGEQAPDFTLPAQDGTSVSLKEFRGKKAVVLCFYPKDDKLVCKKEACLIRDSYSQFVDAGAEVLGVSADSLESHRAFVSKRNLPYRLLSDRDGSVRKLYGIPKAAGGLLHDRVTFVVDKDGTVRLAHRSLMNAEEHVSEALRVLKAIDSPVKDK